MTWSLVILDNEELLQVVESAVKSALPQTPCKVARNLKEGQTLLGEWGVRQCEVMVIGLTTRLDAGHAPSVDARQLTGLDFVRDMRPVGADKPPAILLSTFNDADRAAAVAAVPNTRLLTINELFTRLVPEVTGVVKAGAPPVMHHVDLDIVLRRECPCTWRMKGSEGPAMIEDSGVFDITMDELLELQELSAPANSGNQMFLRRLGLRVYSVLMANALKNDSLESKLRVHLDKFGGLEFARIRFNVDQFTHGILLETLAKPEARNRDPEFWMLKTPMFRKFGDRGDRYPLFKDTASRENPVDALLIQGDVDAFSLVAPVDNSFQPLTNARDEIEWLHDYLTSKKKDEFGIGEVTVLRYEDHEPGTFADVVQKTMASKRFGFVHYAGHSGLDEGKQAYLFLGGKDADVVSLERFSLWAQTIQFVFLSSCQSADSQFIMQLVERQVPAVMGYAWPVADDVASIFAQTFYESLFGMGRDKRFVEYAFMRAKQALHRSYPTKAHWAAPLLFMQVLEVQSTHITA